MNVLVKSVEAEYRRYKAMAEGAIAQVPDEKLSELGPRDNLLAPFRKPQITLRRFSRERRRKALAAA